QGLVGQAANTGGLSPEEVQANQLQGDSILSTVNRISGSANFPGTKLLKRNFDDPTNSVGPSALPHPHLNASRQVDATPTNGVVQVVTSATTGQITYSGAAIAGATVNLEVSGRDGTEQLAFASGTTIGQIATAINNVQKSTGVSAVASSNGTLYFNSQAYGANA